MSTLLPSQPGILNRITLLALTWAHKRLVVSRIRLLGEALTESAKGWLILSVNSRPKIGREAT